MLKSETIRILENEIKELKRELIKKNSRIRELEKSSTLNHHQETTKRTEQKKPSHRGHIGANIEK